MKKILSIVSLLAAVCSATVYANPRVEVPVYLEEGGKHFFINVRIGNSEDLLVMLDTGAAGLRILKTHAGHLNVTKTGERDKVMYGDGTSGLQGEVVLGDVSIGNFRLPGKTALVIVDERVCLPGARSGCSPMIETREKGRPVGTIGLSIHKVDKVIKRTIRNPLTEDVPMSYILIGPTKDGEVGKLIINPTEAEKSSFEKFQLTAKGQRIPVCMDGVCSSVILDTGTTGSRVSALPASVPLDADDSVIPGTRINFTFQNGAKGFTYSTIAGPKGNNKILVAPDRGILGITFYKSVKVLYDQARGEIGLASR